MKIRQNKYIIFLLIPIIFGFTFYLAEAKDLTSPLKNLPLIINSYFDHSKPGYTSTIPIIDDNITIYTTEVGTKANGICGSINSIFDYYTQPNKGGRCISYDGHNGVDFRAQKGDDVLATAPGIIQSATQDDCNGKMLRIWHPDLGYSTLHAHLDSFIKTSGNINRSDLIAKAGNTGSRCTTGPHLHFGVRDAQVAGNVMDPYGWSGTTTDPWPHNKGYLWTTDPPSLKPPATYVSGQITKDTTWTATNSPYVVQGQVTVNPGITLTIDPGVIVKFEDRAYMNINGNLTAKGIAKDKIHFTSIKDDSVGGDTNGDKDNTKPAPGDYKYINFFASSTGVFDYSTIRYGGNRNTNDYHCVTVLDRCVLRVKGANVTIKNSEITKNNDGVYLTEQGNLTIDSSEILDNSGYGVLSNSSSYVNKLKIVNSVFGGGYQSVYIYGPTEFVNYNNSQASPNTAIFLSQTTIKTDQTWNPGIPFVLDGAVGPQVEKDATLTIAPGTIVKVQYTGLCFHSLSVSGRLNIKGTALEKVYFTSLSDDSIGGDTNGNGNASSPYPGIVCGIYFLEESTGFIENAIFRYGGLIPVYGPAAMIKNNRANVNIQNSAIVDSGRYSSGYGIYNYNGTTTISKSSILRSANYGIYNKGSSTVKASNNYWGHESGPYHPTLNPKGKGDKVSDNVDFKPWLKYPYPDKYSSNTVCPGC